MAIGKIFDYLRPPSNWIFYVNVLIAVFIGIFAYTMYVSNAVSYLSDDPKTCVNCHVMRPEFATWQHSSHREVATCNDCHVPHDNVISKYYFKAKDKFHSVSIFCSMINSRCITVFMFHLQHWQMSFRR